MFRARSAMVGARPSPVPAIAFRLSKRTPSEVALLMSTENPP